MRFQLFAAFALSISAMTTGCAGMLEPSSSPRAVADETIVDEQSALAVELAYQAARTAAELAVDAGLVKGEQALELAEADRLAYEAVRGVRAAYEAGQANSYLEAVPRAREAVARVINIIRGEGR